MASPLERKGDFSELLNPGITQRAQPVQLYQPNSGGTATLSCNGQNNVFCPQQIDPVALKLINLMPLPNTAVNGALNYNFVASLKTSSHNWQWDQRLDWNISSRDSAYVTLGYNNLVLVVPPPFGYTLDGGSAVNNNLLESLMVSETHLFSPTFTNQVRFGINWAQFSNLAINGNNNVAAQFGITIPFGPSAPFNGGLPDLRPGDLSAIGTTDYEPNVQRQNLVHFQDNASKTIGRHSLKFGLNLQPMRIFLLQPPHGRGTYYYRGLYTSNLGDSYTGDGLADFYANQMTLAYVSPSLPVRYYRNYRSAFAQDDWRVNSKLTLNLGLRYDYFQPISQKTTAFQISFARTALESVLDRRRCSSPPRSRVSMPAFRPPFPSSWLKAT